MDWELTVLLLIIFSVMGYGFFPVILQIREEKKQSPWAYVQVEEKVEPNFNISAATQELDVDIPNFNSIENLDTTDEIQDFNDVHSEISVPDDEIWNNVEYLVSNLVKESSIPVSNFEMEEDETEEHLPTLSPQQYNAILSKFGEKVANLITCTPFKGTLGSQVMIGQFFKESNSIQFDGHSVELKNEIPKQVDGEFLVIKGNYLENGQFFVQYWEDPSMIEAGYSLFNEEADKIMVI